MTVEFRSCCPIASALDILGDRWTLIILRMIFAGRRRYGDLMAMPEGISTNILADRLAMLVDRGLLTKVAYQQRPARYEYRLTGKGADLLPVLQALGHWAGRHIPDRWAMPDWFIAAQPRDFYPQAQDG